MTEIFRSSVVFIKEEATAGEFETFVSGDSMPIRDGFSLTGELETIESDELVNDIAPSKSQAGGENVTGSMPSYVRHSGTEGVPPQGSILLESCIGSETAHTVEYTTSATGSTVGDLTTPAKLKMDSGDEANFTDGQALLIKSPSGWHIRNVSEVDTTNGELILNFNLPQGTVVDSVALGKVVHYKPTASGHKSYTVGHYQAATNASFNQIASGCKTTGVTLNFESNAFAEINYDFEGNKLVMNGIHLNATNNALDFDDGSGEKNVLLAEKMYRSPIELSREIENKMNALTSDNVTCLYNNMGRFVIATDGSTLSLLFTTGANNANSVASLIGFDGTDKTGALSYTSDSDLTYSPSVAPSYNETDTIVVKNAQIVLGDFHEITCRTVGTVAFDIATENTDVPSVCSETGYDSSLTTSRTVSFTADVAVEKHDVGIFDKLYNNTTTSVMFNCGPKSGSNWIGGRCFNVYMANASITAAPLAEQDSYCIFEVECSGFVTTSKKDIHLNYV